MNNLIRLTTASYGIILGSLITFFLGLASFMPGATDEFPQPDIFILAAFGLIIFIGGYRTLKGDTFAGLVTAATLAAAAGARALIPDIREHFSVSEVVILAAMCFPLLLSATWGLIRPRESSVPPSQCGNQS